MVPRLCTLRFLALFTLLLTLLLAVPLSAQQMQPPPGTIGRVEGNDVSIEGGAAAANGTPTVAPSMWVANGSVITVHSGQARMTLLGGGEVDICGPAKLTLLQSGAAVTVALNFGRLRVQLPATAQLRIFTPTIVATPIDIGGAPRDFTIGLDLNDSLCVVATSGALRLEHQFTGEGLIVPQAGEFFLAAGQLQPVAGVPGTCQCESLQARATAPLPPSPEMGLTSKPHAEPAPAPVSAPASTAAAASAATSAPASAPAPVSASASASVRAPAPLVVPTPSVASKRPNTSAAQPAVAPEIASKPPDAAAPLPAMAPPAELPAPAPAIQIRQLAIANQIHPNAPPQENEVPAPPAVSIPIYKAVMPPLTFSADAPAPPGEPSTDMILLVRIAHVEPEWQFTGHVDAPQITQISAHEPAKSSKAAAQGRGTQKKKGGFWAAFKRAFGGGGDETQN